MNAELGEVLGRLPPGKRLTPEACEFLDREIRRGAELNLSQREGVLAIVQACIEHGLLLSAPYESFFAFVYQEWCVEANTSEEGQKKLDRLVQAISADPALAPLVSRTARHVQKERGARKQEAAAAAAVPAKPAAAPARAAKSEAAARPVKAEAAGRDTPNAYVKLMQSARLGLGDALTPNLELAAQYAEDAVAAFPSAPKVLFEAGGCHQLLGQKGTALSAEARYAHMRKAVELYQQCLALLKNEPYASLKGEYDQWRKGLGELIVKTQKELAALEAPANPQHPAAASEAKPAHWLAWGGVAVAVTLVLAVFIFSGLARDRKPRATVFGKVRYDGNFLTSGTINFVGEGSEAKARINGDGSYEVANVPVGPVQVSIRSMSTSVEQGDGDKIKWVMKSLIPEKYNHAHRSGLKFEITSERQEINIELED